MKKKGDKKMGKKFKWIIVIIFTGCLLSALPVSTPPAFAQALVPAIH